MNKYIPTVYIAFLLSCNSPGANCEQTNPILRQNEPRSETYQTELRRLIDDHPHEVEFYFEGRDSIGGKSFLVVNAVGEDFCGKLWTLVKTDDRFTAILQNNSGYRGARLEGFKVVAAENQADTFFAYQKMESIVD
ncbi:MAG: hypothetical protein AAB316_23725 [Bacteroidota bacterium]